LECGTERMNWWLWKLMVDVGWEMKVDRDPARTYTFTWVDGQRLTVHDVLSSRGIFMVDSCQTHVHIFNPASIRSKSVDLHWAWLGVAGQKKSTSSVA
jgi:hypothetical protein